MINRIDSEHETRIQEILTELPDTDPDKPDDEWFKTATEALRVVEQRAALGLVSEKCRDEYRGNVEKYHFRRRGR